MAEPVRTQSKVKVVDNKSLESLTACSELSKKLSKAFRRLGEQVEDSSRVQEFISSLEALDIFLKPAVTVDSKKLETRAVTDLQTALTEYHQLVNQLEKSERLERFVDFHRLRAKLERINVHIQKLKEVAFKEIVPSKSFRRDKKADSDEEKWDKSFDENFFVAWPMFVSVLERWLGTRVTKEEEVVLKYCLDPHNFGMVSKWKWEQFLKSFGPLKDQHTTCVKNMKLIMREKWFYGFLSKTEAESVLSANCPVGTYLFRFGKSIGSFCIAFVGKDKIYHVAIKSCGAEGYSVFDKGAKVDKPFKSLHAIVQHYSYALLKPCTSELPFQSYFQGELSTQESNEVLYGEEEGTFLLRYSNSVAGALAISYVDESGMPRHLLTTQEKGFWKISSENIDEAVYPSIPELIANYPELLKKPLGISHHEVQNILKKWREENLQQENIIDSIWKPFM